MRIVSVRLCYFMRIILALIDRAGLPVYDIVNAGY